MCYHFFMVPLPRFLFIQINDRCNLRCGHCHYWKPTAGDRSASISQERRGEIIEEFAEMSPGGAVVTCGGEGMLDLPTYFGVCSACRRFGLKCLSVVNGTVISTSQMASRMMLEGPDEITVSLDSHREELHDRMRGVEGSYKEAVRALKLLLEARSQTGISDKRIYVMMLIFDENYFHLDAMYDFVLNGIGADKMKINILQPTFGCVTQDDSFFANHSRMDADYLMAQLRVCDAKYNLGLNSAWVSQVGMYVRSVSQLPRHCLCWGSLQGTTDCICNSPDRNIMVDLLGTARLCFSTFYPGFQLREKGDLRHFWESSDVLRARMSPCKALCGISHSVRRESCTIAGNSRFVLRKEQ